MKMSLKGNTLFLLFIIYSSFHLIISETLYFDKDNLFFTIKKPTGEGQNYAEFILDGNPLSKYVLSAYSDNSKIKRIQLGQSLKGDIYLYLSLKDFSENIYMEIECPSDNTDCTGQLIYSFTEKIELKEGKPCAYYVNRDNEELIFNIDISSKVYNVWARGQYHINTKFNTNNLNQIKKTIENCGDFYIMDERMSSISSVEFSVKPTKGDFINVGFMGFNKNNNYDSNVNIEMDGPSLTGYLERNSLDEVCYTLNENDATEDELVLGNGVIFTKIGYSYIAYLNGDEYLSDQIYTSGFIKNGIYFPEEIEERKLKICIKIPDSKRYPQYKNVNQMVFVYQLEKTKENKLTIYEPQLNGVLYSRSIKTKSKTAFIAQNNGVFGRMSLNLMSLSGFPKMYVIDCDNYPLCNYDDQSLQKAIRPRNINRFSSLYVNKKDGIDDSPISKKQTVFVVECMKSQNISEKDPLPKYMDVICDFNTLIYKDNDYIELLEENYFNQFALRNQEHIYKIKIGGEIGIKKVFIDIMTYVGDVEVDISEIENKNIKADLYYQINKIFISVKFNDNSENFEDLYFTIKGVNNTYYTTLITFAKKDNEIDSFITNKLQTGMSYLVTIDSSQFDESDKNKIIKFKNERIYDLIPYMVNFYSLNCEIIGYKITYEGEEEMDSFEKFTQDVVKIDDYRYPLYEYEYRIKVNSPDYSQYSGSLCKVYASAIEISEKHEDYFSRDILIPDNTPQQIRFSNNVKHVSFGYIHVDFKYDLLIKFNLKHIAQYNVKFYFENYERKKGDVTIVSNNMLILKSEEWMSEACKDPTRVCYITLDITLQKTREHDDPVLEFSIKSLNTHFVDYIPKNLLKIDYVRNNEPQLYYTEIGSNEYGYISYNFLRGSGRVFARIVNPSEITKTEENAIWRGKYRLPKEDDLELEHFVKKIKYSTQENCQYGCYLLISVFSDVKGYDLKKDNYFSYSLIVHSSPMNINFKYVPIIKIPVDEYVVGSVEPSTPDNRMYDFYSVRLNYDANQVLIDFQSDIAGIFINVGNNRPTVDDAHFVFWSKGSDSIYKISKEDIMKEVVGSKENGLKDVILTIGIKTFLKDSIFTTPFSFAVRLEDNEKNEIYRVSSDQKVLCNTKKVNEKYRCVYVIDYNFVHDYNSFFIYANVQDKSTLLTIYADYINSNTYEMSSKDELNDYIPNSLKYKFTTKNKNIDYLDITSGIQNEDYLIVTVEATKETTIEFMSNVLIHQKEISPNPSSPQIYSVLPGKDFYLNLPDRYMEMVNIISLGGEGEINWGFDTGNKYKLKGRDDRLSITSNESSNDHKLHVRSIGDSNTSPFVFVVEYNIRNNHVNFDALNLEKSINYVYVNSDFPITYYAPLDKFNEKKDSASKDNYYDIFFTFALLETTYEKELTYYENHPFTMKGFIVKESTVYNARLDPSIVPKTDEKTIFGSYDQALRTGLIRITQENIDQTKDLDNEKPYLYLEIDKEESFKSVRRYKRVSLETSVSFINSQVPISEISNQFGYLNTKQSEANYILKNNPDMKYMYLEFSCKDDSLSIYVYKGNLDNKVTKYGKTIYYIETKNLDELIRFTVRRTDQGKDSVQYFLFRYAFENSINRNKYSIKDTKVTVYQTKGDDYSDFKVKVYPLEIPNSNIKEYDITYIVRLVADKESKSKKANLALKPVRQIIKEFYNPKLKEKEELLTFDIYKIDKSKEISYVEVILQIKHNEVLEYLSYDLTDTFEVEKEKESKVALIICIVIGSVLLIVVAVLIVVIIIFNNKNKDLLEKVNKVSFAENDQRGDEDLLLSKDEK